MNKVKETAEVVGAVAAATVAVLYVAGIGYAIVQYVKENKNSKKKK